MKTLLFIFVTIVWMNITIGGSIVAIWQLGTALFNIYPTNVYTVSLFGFGMITLIFAGVAICSIPFIKYKFI